MNVYSCIPALFTISITGNFPNIIKESKNYPQAIFDTIS